MSIIAYYLHVDETQLQALGEEPDRAWGMDSDPRFAGAALFTLDKDYEILAWLLSDKKRREHVQQTAIFQAMARESDAGGGFDQAEFARVKAEELARLGATPEDTDALPTDAALLAIEGRGTDAQRDARISFGLGAARVFTPAEVTQLSAALNAVADAQLGQHFDRQTMATLDVGGVGWLEEPDAVLGDYLVPAFHRLRAFYADAAQRGHRVLVVYA